VKLMDVPLLATPVVNFVANVRGVGWRAHRQAVARLHLLRNRHVRQALQLQQIERHAAVAVTH